jgi:hypothetical protein
MDFALYCRAMTRLSRWQAANRQTPIIDIRGAEVLARTTTLLGWLQSALAVGRMKVTARGEVSLRKLNSAMDANGSQLDIRAGLLAAIRWGVIGAIAPVIIVAAMGIVEFWQELRLFGAYDEWLRWCIKASLGPVIGCTLVLAGAGWTSQAPRPTRSIVSSVLVITAASVAMWFLLALAKITPPRYKKIEHPVMYPSEVFVLIGPPVIAAAVLTAMRCNDTGTTRSF